MGLPIPIDTTEAKGCWGPRAVPRGCSASFTSVSLLQDEGLGGDSCSPCEQQDPPSPATSSPQTPLVWPCRGQSSTDFLPCPRPRVTAAAPSSIAAAWHPSVPGEGWKGRKPPTALAGDTGAARGSCQHPVTARGRGSPPRKEGALGLHHPRAGCRVCRTPSAPRVS